MTKPTSDRYKGPKRLEPVQCQSIEPLGVLMNRRIRCELDDYHGGPHKCGNRTWEVKEPFSTMDHMKRAGF